VGRLQDTGDEFCGTTAYTATHSEDLIPLLGHSAEMTLGSLLMAAGATGGAMDLIVVGGVVGVPLDVASAGVWLAASASACMAHGLTNDLNKVYKEAQDNSAVEGGGTGGSEGQRASDLGCNRRIPPQKAPFDSHGRSVYTNGQEYISTDRDQHQGVEGARKRFDSKGRRIGTYSPQLKERLGD
jgi:hypothetical protein